MENIIYSLIIKSFRNEIKDKNEISVLNEWLANEENREAYIKMRSLWDETILIYSSEDINSAHALKHFRRIVRSAGLGRASRRYSAWGSYAAAILIIAIAFAGSYSFIVRDRKNSNPDRISSIKAMSAEQSHEDASSVSISGTSGKCKAILPDGTKVVLRKGATIEYKTDYGKFDRDVYVAGTAYFDVAHDDAKTFTARTYDLSIKVHGTAFTVDNNADFSSISLLRGSVSVETASGKESQLRPGQKAMYNQVTDDLTLSTTDAELDALWSLDQISFNRKSLAYVCKYLSAWYGVEICASDKVTDNFAFSFTVKDEPLEKILMLMKETSNLRYKITSDGEIKIY